MLEVLKDLLIGFLGALLVECAPKTALFLVRLAARAMPPELREQTLNDWTAEILSVEGNAQKLVAAFWILVNVPNIRSSFGYPPVSFAWVKNSIIARVWLILLDLYMEPFEELSKSFALSSRSKKIKQLTALVGLYIAMTIPFMWKAQDQNAVVFLLGMFLCSAVIVIATFLFAAKRVSEK